MTKGMKRIAIVVAVAVVMAVVSGITDGERAQAHPLGNFTINTYSRLDVYADVVRLRYVVDMAEIPAFQERTDLDRDGDGDLSADEERAYLRERQNALAAGLRLMLDDTPAPLAVIDSSLSHPAGQGGLTTLRLDLVLEAPAAFGGGSVQVSYRDENFAERIGWREIVVRSAQGVRLVGAESYARDRSDALRTYPEDLLSSPVRDRRTSFSYTTSPGAETAPSRPADVPVVAEADSREGSGSAFVGLIGVGDVTLAVMLLSLLAAFGFGALHALEPGHGKAFVAAYFIGMGGEARQALMFGLVVAISHAVGVFVIGLLVLFGSQYIVPERLYPWLSLAAGLLVLGLGVALLVDRLGGVQGVTHRLRHHHHHGGHAHHSDATGRGGAGRPSWRNLLVLGLVDGFVPSPSTLVLLLAAVSLNRIEFGALLIVAFSLGLATVLSVVAVVVQTVRRMALRWRSPVGGEGIGVTGMAGQRIMARVAPLGAAGLLVAVGLLYTVRALATPGLVV